MVRCGGACVSTIAVVDLSGIFWAAWMSRKDADPASGPHDWTVAKVRRFAEQFPHIGIACDARDNWRKAVSPTYKAQRMERPAEAWSQLDHTVETLRREGFPIWLFDGYEADDVMGTVAYQAPRSEAKHSVVLITNDKDLRQCIRDGEPSVRVLTPGDSHKPPTFITMANCGMDKTLIDPRLVRDYLALRGDGSDNLPGVKNVGPVKALALLKRWGSFPGVIAAVEAQEPALLETQEGKLVAASRKDAELTWELAGLKEDVPVDWSEALRERVQQAVPSPMRDATDADFEDAEPDSRKMHEEHMAAESAAGRTAKPTGGPCADPNVALAVATAALAAPVPWTMQLEPTNSGGAVKLAQYLADSRMFPSLVTPEQVLAAILLGRAHGIGAVVACLNCTPIKGRMSMSSALIIGIVQRSDVCEYIEGVDGDAKSCTWVAKRKGRPERSHTFTIEEAHKAGYTLTRGGDGAWQKDPAGMLWLRTGTRIARRVFNDVISGVYSTEEMNDV